MDVNVETWNKLAVSAADIYDILNVRSWWTRTCVLHKLLWFYECDGIRCVWPLLLFLCLRRGAHSASHTEAGYGYPVWNWIPYGIIVMLYGLNKGGNGRPVVTVLFLLNPPFPSSLSSASKCLQIDNAPFLPSVKWPCHGDSERMRWAGSRVIKLSTPKWKSALERIFV